MTKPGPRPLGNTAELKLTVSPELDAGLSALAAMTGVSKATAVRYSIMMTLSVVGLLPTDAHNELTPTKTRNNRRNK